MHWEYMIVGVNENKFSSLDVNEVDYITYSVRLRGKFLFGILNWVGMRSWELMFPPETSQEHYDLYFKRPLSGNNIQR
jgi:hypothetical protein